jgi:hypothetical protein
MARPTESKKKRIFVAMPFRTEHDPIFRVLKDAAELTGAEVVRLDEEHFAGSIISQIRAEIDGADVVTAIVSEENGNVYYEIGLAHCQRKPVVLLTSDIASLKFDLRDHRAIVYDRANPGHVLSELARTLSAVMDMPTEPHAYVSTVLGGTSQSMHCVEDRLHKALVTIQANVAFGLQPPIHISKMDVMPDTREIAVIVEDFMGTEVRAIIDVNGIVGRAKRIGR